MYSRVCLLAPLVRCFGKKPRCPSFLVFCGAWFRVVVLSAMDKLKLKCKWLCNVGYLGCHKRTPENITMDQASKRLRSQGQTVSKGYGSEDFWSTSTFELDHTLNNIPSDPQSGGGSQSGPPEFVNQGLLLWNQTRQQWIGNRKSESITEIQEARISSNATYENLLGNNKPFPQRISMREMVDFLVDVWEQEGLYD